MLAIHRTVIDHAALPLSSWLPQVDTAASVQMLLRQLSEVAVVDGTHREQPPVLVGRYLRKTPLAMNACLRLYSRLSCPAFQR